MPRQYTQAKINPLQQLIDAFKANKGTLALEQIEKIGTPGILLGRLYKTHGFTFKGDSRNNTVTCTLPIEEMKLKSKGGRRQLLVFTGAYEKPYEPSTKGRKKPPR